MYWRKCHRFTTKVWSRIHCTSSKKRISHACCINVLAQALYRVFSRYEESSPHFLPAMEHMRSACFGYFKLGDPFVAGPIGMLAGLVTNPWTLIFHFCLVAVFAFSRTLFPSPSLSKLYTCKEIFWSASKLITPLLYNEQVLSFISIQW